MMLLPSSSRLASVQDRPSVRTPGAARRPDDPGQRSQYLSEADCQDIMRRLARYATGGGETHVYIQSRWRGNIRWARNRIVTSGEDRDNRVGVTRSINGVERQVQINAVHTPALVAALRQAERMTTNGRELLEADLVEQSNSPFPWQDEPATAPALFIDATYQLDANQRAGAAQALMQGAAAAGMLSAGYIEVVASSYAFLTSWGYAKFFQYTWAQYSNTVRDPKGVGSGWAGVDWPDWARIDGAKLSAIALEKCLKSRNPVAIEPGRYETILEPQAVCDLVSQLFGYDGIMRDRGAAEQSPGHPFHATTNTASQVAGGGTVGRARFGERVIDERLTLRSDPMDPDLGFPPWNREGNLGWYINRQVYHPVTWIEQGVLRHLGESRDYAVTELGRPTGLPAPLLGGFRMSVTGATASVEEMIATTKRGLVVTRFDQIDAFNPDATLCRGYTRDGLWLVENGKISKPIKNLMFVESILFVLNNVEQVGVPQRVFHPVPGGVWAWWLNPAPLIVPALKVRDFSFTALSGSI